MPELSLNELGMIQKQSQVILGHRWCTLVPVLVYYFAYTVFAELAVLWPSIRHTRLNPLCVYPHLLVTFSSYLVFWWIKHLRLVIVLFASLHLLCHSTCLPCPSHSICFFLFYPFLPPKKGAERSWRPCDHLPPVLRQPYRQRLRWQHAQSVVSHHRKGMG